MSRQRQDILKKAAPISLAILALCCILLAGNPAAAATTAPKDFCTVTEETTPDETKDANCTKDSCETKPGCLDPAPVKPAKRFSSVPGTRPQSYDKNGKPVGSTGHKGNDIAAAEGSTIYAAADGTIEIMGFQMNSQKNTGWGNYIKIKHDDGVTYTLYAHMKCFASKKDSSGKVRQLKNGSKVKKGEVIGFVGTTGGVSGPHLHYEIIKNGVYYNATLEENEKSGMLCEIPDQFVQSGMSPEGTAGTSSGGASGNASVSCGPQTGCAQVYNDNTITALSHKYESGGNYCINNKCASGDAGGCSYGATQLACGPGTMKKYLQYLQKSYPSVYAALGGGDVNTMAKKACTAPATEFKQKFANMCSSSVASDFVASQDKFTEGMFSDTKTNRDCLKSKGFNYDDFSPSVKAALYSISVQFGSACKMIKNSSVRAPMTEEAFLNEIYAERSKTDKYFKSSSAAVQEGVKKRFARELADIQESLKVSKAWEEEQKKPEGERRSYEEVVKGITGKEPCASGQSSSFSNCSISGGAASGEERFYEGKNCAPTQYIGTYGNCMFCPLFEVIFNTASKMAKLSFDKLSHPIMLVVLVAWALWLAFEVMKHISSLQTKDAPTLFKTILAKGLVVMVVVIFLQGDSSQFFSMALEPIFNTGFKLAQLVVGDGACSPTYHLIEDGGLPVSMGNSILCTVEAIQHKLQNTMALGASSMCVGLFIKATLFIFPSIPYLLTGLLIWCGAGIMIIIFPFLMLDVIFQLTVACALIPAAIGAYPFKATQGYVKHVWNTFINAMFNFVFLSVIIFILTTAIEETVYNSIYQSIGASKGYAEDQLAALLDQNFMTVVVEDLAWGGIAVIKIVFVLLLGWACLDEASDFANEFAGSGLGSKGIGSKIGGLAAGGAKALGLKAWGGAKKVGGAIGENIKESAKDWNRNRQMESVMNSGNRTEVKDDKGNVVGYQIQTKSWFRKRDKTLTVSVGKDGTKMLTTTKDYGNGKVKTTKSDGYLKQEVMTDKDGKVLKSKLSIQSAGLKGIRNQDGSLNNIAMAAALKNSAFDESMIKTAAMQEYAKQSFPEMKDRIEHMDASNISIGKDENGRDVIEMRETDPNGASRVLRMSFNEDNSRGMVEFERTNSNGERTSVATDGMFNRSKSCKVLKSGEEIDVSTTYAMSAFYAKRSKFGVNVDGELAEIFEEHGGSAFSSEELKEIKENFQADRRNGTPRSTPGIK